MRKRNASQRRAAGATGRGAFKTRCEIETAVDGFVYPGTPELSTGVVAAFHKGLGETGFVEGRNVMVEFRFAYNDNTRVTELVGEWL